MKQAAAYLRRSSVSGDNPGDASREAQLAAVHGMCGDEVEIYADWGISGQKDDRPDYLRLKADIDAGKIGSVCAYSLSRLGRSARELLAFVDLCTSHDVTIRTSVEHLDTSSAMGRAMLTVMAAFAQLEADVARERQASARAARESRGDDMGGLRYGYKSVRDDNGRIRHVRDESVDLDRVRQAFDEAGSVLGAARLLKAWGVPAPRGGEQWSTSLLTRVLASEGIIPKPDWMRAFVPDMPSERRPKRASAPLAGLLRCPFCSRRLTPNVVRGQYYCANGSRDRANHPRYAVREVDVMPFLREEAARYRAPAEAVAIEGIETRRAAIEERLEIAREDYYSGKDKNRERARTVWEREQARAERETAELQGRATVATLHPEVDWDVPADVLNSVLRSIWREVRLDDNLLATEVEWIFPELRA